MKNVITALLVIVGMTTVAFAATKVASVKAKTVSTAQSVHYADKYQKQWMNESGPYYAQ